MDEEAEHVGARPALDHAPIPELEDRDPGELDIAPGRRHAEQRAVVPAALDESGDDPVAAPEGVRELDSRSGQAGKDSLVEAPHLRFAHRPGPVAVKGHVLRVERQVLVEIPRVPGLDGPLEALDHPVDPTVPVLHVRSYL